MNPVLKHLLDTQSVTLPNGEIRPLHSHLPPLEGQLLQDWVRDYRPKKLLEIGLAYGLSTLFICDALAGQSLDHYHIIDAFQSAEWHNLGVAHLQQAGYSDRYTLHERRSELCLPDLLAQGVRCDFAFIDGWHTFDHVLTEFFYVNRMLEVGGIVIFDDMHLPSLQKVVAYIERYPCYERLSIPDALRQTKAMKVRRMMKVPLARIAGFMKSAEDRRDWDWFEEF